MASEDRIPEFKERWMNSCLLVYLKIERGERGNRSRHYYMKSLYKRGGETAFSD